MPKATQSPKSKKQGKTTKPRKNAPYTVPSLIPNKIIKTTHDPLKPVDPTEFINLHGRIVEGFIISRVAAYVRPEVLQHELLTVYGLAIDLSTIHAIMTAEVFEARIATARQRYNEDAKHSAGYSRRWVSDQLVEAMEQARLAGDPRAIALIAKELADITGIKSPHSIEISHSKTENVTYTESKSLTLSPMPLPLGFNEQAEATIMGVEVKRKEALAAARDKANADQ